MAVTEEDESSSSSCPANTKLGSHSSDSSPYAYYLAKTVLRSSVVLQIVRAHIRSPFSNDVVLGKVPPAIRRPLSFLFFCFLSFSIPIFMFPFRCEQFLPCDFCWILDMDISTVYWVSMLISCRSLNTIRHDQVCGVVTLSFFFFVVHQVVQGKKVLLLSVIKQSSRNGWWGTERERLYSTLVCL